jgi:PAS domain S-box-containing protein
MIGLIGTSFLHFQVSREFILIVSGVSTASIIAITVVGLRFISRVTQQSYAMSASVKVPLISFRNILRLTNSLYANNQIVKEAVACLNKMGSEQEGAVITTALQQHVLGKAIIKLNDEIHRFKAEEQQRNWITRGLAMFGEILDEKGEIKEFQYKILSRLAAYLNAQQGVLLIEQQEDNTRYLEMVACYAPGKREYTGRVYEGQGYLGQCMLDKTFMGITNIPPQYTVISSGLGQVKPSYIAIVPLLLNGKFCGAIELSFFESLQSYQIDFLNRVAERIAATIVLKTTLDHTQALLEKSEILTEELKDREQEREKNLTELVSVQQQMAKKQQELNSHLSAINNTIAAAEFDMNGNFVTGNEIFLKVMGYGLLELKGYSYRQLMHDDATVHVMWENLMLGKFFSGDFKINDKSGKELWLSGTFSPIMSGDGTPDKVMMYAQFVTQEKERVHELSIMVNALKATLPVIEFTDDFTCKTANEKFLKLIGLNRVSLRGKTIHSFIDPAYANVLEKIQLEILSNDFTTILLPIRHNDRTICYETSVSVAKTLEGKIARVIFILVKEIEEKVTALESTYKM